MTKDDWITYKGHPYQVRALTSTSLRAIDAVTTDIITIYRDKFKYVKLIEAPIYQAGDTVLYEGEITRVIRHNDCYVFYKYEILLNDKEILVTPFQLTKIDY